LAFKTLKSGVTTHRSARRLFQRAGAAKVKEPLPSAVTDPDFELRGGGVCFACRAGFSSFCDFFFFYPK